MQKYDLITLKNTLIATLLCVLLAIIWAYILIVPGAFLIDSIIYRSIYIATMSVVGGVLIAIIVAKWLLLKI